MKMRQSQQITWNLERRIELLVLIIFVMTTLAFLSAAPVHSQEKLLDLDLPPPDVPQPQLFCGYCHVLTYPGVVQKGYELWKKGKHNKFGCVECHYPPGTSVSMPPGAATSEITKASHIPAKPPGHFSYLPLGGDTIRTRPQIADASCMTAACHSKPDDKFKTKKIKFTEKVLFVHEPHLDKKKQIEGQQVNCVSCHQHESDQKKFEVTKASCYQCHFTNVKFNESRGKCELCHELPQKPIQTSGEKPITHQILKDADVACGSCNYEVIQASGRARYEAYYEKGILKTALVIGAGNIKKENCVSCHDQTKALKEVENKKLMHEKHVSIKNARCFDCHQPIMHKKADLKQPTLVTSSDPKSTNEKLMQNQFIADSCMTCHPQPHRLQRLLAEGLKRENVPATPGFHFKVSATCMACHLESQVTDKGEKVLKASANSCVACHKGRENLLNEWKADLEREIKFTKEVEQEALDALTPAKLSEAKLAEAKKMMAEGKENLNFVQFGNGVHNKKYSLFVLDAAITRFEDVLDFIEENQQ
jgi:nitrate/TMAO reductase-like tetraheme cytochrome c subunit